MTDFGAFSFQPGTSRVQFPFQFSGRRRPNLYFTFQTPQFSPPRLAVGRWTPELTALLQQRQCKGSRCNNDTVQTTECNEMNTVEKSPVQFNKFSAIKNVQCSLKCSVQCIALHESADVLGYCSKPTLGVTLGLNSGSKIPLARGCRISPMHIMGYFQRLGTFLGMTPHQSTEGFKYFLGMDIFKGNGS